MTLSVKQINALQPLEPPRHPSYHLHTVLLIRSVPALSPRATLYGLYTSLYMRLWWRRWIRLSLSASISPTALPLSPPICLTFRQSPLSVALLSPHCQASGGSHLKITRPGHTQPSPTACQFTHGKGITRLLLGSCKLLLMVMQIIRVRSAPPANLFFMWVHS